MEVKLISLSGGQWEQIIRSWPYKIGRPSCGTDLIIAGRGASNKHCQLEAESRDIYLRNTGTGGTYVNFLTIEKGKRQKLRNGDLILLGFLSEPCAFFEISISGDEPGQVDWDQRVATVCRKSRGLRKSLSNQVTASDNSQPMNGCLVKERLRKLKNEMETQKKDCEKRLQETEPSATKENMEMKKRLMELEEELKRAETAAAETAAIRKELQAGKAAAEVQLAEEKRKKDVAETKLEVMIAAEAAASPKVRVRDLEDDIEEEFACHICIHLLVEPVILNCSHVFCSFCWDQWKGAGNATCPLCRISITTCIRATAMDRFIDRFADSLSAEFRARRKDMIAERNKAREAWMNSRASGSRDVASNAPHANMRGGGNDSEDVSFLNEVRRVR